jgi:hypothetical protein
MTPRAQLYSRAEVVAALRWFHDEVVRISISDEYDMGSGWVAIAELYAHPKYKPLAAMTAQPAGRRSRRGA